MKEVRTLNRSRLLIVCILLTVIVSVSVYAGWKSGYDAALHSSKVNELEASVKVLKGQNTALTARLMNNLVSACVNQANADIALANRTDWTVTIHLDNATLTVTAIIRYGTQGNGTMIVCR